MFIALITWAQGPPVDAQGQSLSTIGASLYSTDCDPITTLPWVENFDTYGTGTTVFPDCWTRNTTQADRPHVHTTNYSAPGSLYFYATLGNYNIAALPKFDESIDISELRLNFWYRNSYATDELKVGVMEDPTDETTWEEIDVITAPSTATWYPIEVSLASYEGSANYIALRIDYTSTYCYGYVDDLVVSYIPDCAKPTHITLLNPTANSVDISWNPGNEGDYAWHLYYKKSSQTSWDSVPVFDNPYTLDNLDANTAYELEMKTDCGIELSGPTNTI